MFIFNGKSTATAAENTLKNKQLFLHAYNQHSVTLPEIFIQIR